MKYELLTTQEADRFWNKFMCHDKTVNEKFMTFCSNENADRSLCDRDRFVEKFFKPYIGKCIAAIDKIFSGSMNTCGENQHYFHMIKPLSIYSMEYDKLDTFNFTGTKIIYPRKNYFRIHYAANHNLMYGDGGYIEIRAEDVIGNMVSWKLDRHFLRNFQFKLISEEEFRHIADLFKDDRDMIPIVGQRILLFNKMIERKLCRKNCAQDKIPTIYEPIETMALDCDDAWNKFNEMKGVYVHSLDPKR